MRVNLRMSVAKLFLPLLLIFISCHHQGTRSLVTEENSIEFDTSSVVVRHHLEGDTTNPYCNLVVDFIYPVHSDHADLSILQQHFVRNIFGSSYDTIAPPVALERYVSNYIDNYTKDAMTYRESANEIKELNHFIPGIEDSDSEHRSEDSFYSYYEYLADSIVYNKNDVLSFQVKQSNNKGGTASYDSYRNYVINLKTGKQVSENDIFINGYAETLQHLIIASLQQQSGAESVEELEDFGFFGVREIVPNQNFLLNDKGIIYTYNKGEYSAYQLDAPEVFLSYEALLPLIKENSIASKLANL